MSQISEPAISIHVDQTNPGQFFACCGLLELADRLWQGAEGWFVADRFNIRSPQESASIPITLGGLIEAMATAPLRQLDPNDATSSPLEISSPFNLRLDWWKDEHAGGTQFKLWAGQMSCVKITQTLQNAFSADELRKDDLFDFSGRLSDEPFCFDSRRGSYALPLDIGFSTDPLSKYVKVAAFPAVEFLCFVGLQRFRAIPAEKPHMFEYQSWSIPLETGIAATAACGLLTHIPGLRFRFEITKRTKYLKEFTTATLINNKE